MKNINGATIAASFVSAGLFLLIANLGLGVLFAFLPTIPLFLLGFVFPPKQILQAGIISGLLLAILTNSPISALLFFAGFAVPCFMICYLLAWYQDVKIDENMPILRLWYPVGLVIAYLAIYACVMLTIATISMSMFSDTTLPSYIATNINEQIQELEKEYSVVLETSSQSIAFMLCGFFAWFWVVALWFHAYLSVYLLLLRQIIVRPNLAIMPAPMPNWLLTLLAICTLASIIGGESISFLGKSCAIILLLPYFFQGLAWLQIFTHKWANQSLFMFVIYFSIGLLFWPAIILAGLGLYQHVKMLSRMPNVPHSSFF